MSDPQELPDGSSFFTGSFSLPKDHWLFAKEREDPPMLLRCGTSQVERKELEEAIREGVRYALRTSTMNGKDDDYDPDTVVNNAIIGILGYFTPDGTSDSSDVTP
jgi:hypothetical protein